MAAAAETKEGLFAAEMAQIENWRKEDKAKLETIEKKVDESAKKAAPAEVVEQLRSLADKTAKRVDAFEAKAQLQTEAVAKVDFKSVLDASEEFKAFARAPNGQKLSLKVPSVLKVLTSTELGVLNAPYIRDGVLVYPQRRPRLVDLIRRFDLGGAEVFKYNRETAKSAYGTVHARVDGALGAGDTSAVLTSVDRLMVGQVLRFHGSSLIEKTITSITPSTRTVAWSGAIGAIVPDGTDVTCRRFAATAEGARKPVKFLEAEQKELTLQTLALMIPVTEQRLRSPGVAEWIRASLLAAHRDNLNWHLLYGTGASQQLHGFFSDADLQSYAWSDGIAGDNRADAVLAASDLVESDGLLTAVMCRADWRKILSSKDGEDNYIFGPNGAVAVVNTPAVKSLADLEVVTDNVVDEDDFGVFDLAAASEIIFRSEQSTIALGLGMQLAEGMRAGYVGDDFAYNQLHIRYEEEVEHAIASSRFYVQGEWDSEPTP